MEPLATNDMGALPSIVSHFALLWVKGEIQMSEWQCNMVVSAYVMDPVVGNAKVKYQPVHTES